METDTLCACGCGESVPRTKFPSQQNRFINQHQHRGKNNGNYKKGRQCFACPVCGATFTQWASQHPVTCGKDACYRKWQGIVTAARGRNKVTVLCNECGKGIEMYPSQVAKERNYCNRACAGKANSKYYVGEKGKNWKGGGDTYARRTARERDQAKCVVCGFHLVVDVHHITPRAEGGTNDLSNLITICPNHHRLAHMGIISLEAYRRP